MGCTAVVTDPNGLVGCVYHPSGSRSYVIRIPPRRILLFIFTIPEGLLSVFTVPSLMDCIYHPTPHNNDNG